MDSSTRDSVAESRSPAPLSYTDTHTHTHTHAHTHARTHTRTHAHAHAHTHTHSGVVICRKYGAGARVSQVKPSNWRLSCTTVFYIVSRNWSKIVNFSYPVYLTPPLCQIQLKTTMMGCQVEKSLMMHLSLYGDRSRYRRTDGRSDRHRTMALPRLCIASRSNDTERRISCRPSGRIFSYS